MKNICMGQLFLFSIRERLFGINHILKNHMNSLNVDANVGFVP